MNSFEKQIVNFAVNNNFAAITSLCKSKVEAITNASEQRWKEQILQQFEKKEALEIPFNLESILIAEDIEKFNENRYFVSDREKTVVEEILRAEKVKKHMEMLEIQYSNNVLLYGESGTGKTTLGKYIAKKLNRPYFYINLSNLVDSLLGGTQKNLGRVFDFVRDKECLLMLDEVDAIAIRRGSVANEVGEINRVVISLMQELDRVSNKVLVIAATNRYEIIDDALLRRFQIRHKVERFSGSEKTQMAVKFINDVNKIAEIPFTIGDIADKDETQAIFMTRVIKEMAKCIEKGAENGTYRLNL